MELAEDGVLPTGIPSQVVLKNQNKSTGPVFSVLYDPRLPPIGNIVAKHWRTMTSRDKHLAEVFPRPPLIAFKRLQNIRQHIIIAKVHTQQRQQRKVKGMKKCGKSCTGCQYIKEGKSLKINGVDWKINQTLNCKSYNVVYAVICKKESCRQVYIGDTKRFLKSRLDDHRGYINHGVEATGQPSQVTACQTCLLQL